jgi:hypothetical protein
MKNLILMFATVCLITMSANAQTKKGTVLLGAGSQFSDTEWTQWAITPKIGYFIQDGLAIGAMVHFNTDDEYFPAFTGNWTAVPGSSPVVFVEDGAHSDYTLTNNVREFGVFARYYAARNLFMEVNISSSTSQSEEWVEDVPVFNGSNLVLEDMVLQTRDQSSHVRLGMGYTLVWREHFAVEPFIHLDLIVDGERVAPGGGAMTAAETTDLSGSEFVAGVNFSLFF